MRKASGILLGFDFGLRHIGIAIGQTVTRSAKALTAIKAEQGIPRWDTLDKVVNDWKPEALIVGIPLNMDGTEQKLTHYARDFAELLEKRYALPIHFMDERLTTVAARDKLFTEGGYKALQKNKVDSLSAQLILQAWFDQHSERNI